MLLQNLLIVHRLVVETRDVDVVGKLVADGVGPVVERRGGWPRGIFFADKACQTLGLLPTIFGLLLGNFVPDAPHDDAGMITVAMYHVTQIALRPFIKIFALSIGNFRD